MYSYRYYWILFTILLSTIWLQHLRYAEIKAIVLRYIWVAQHHPPGYNEVYLSFWLGWGYRLIYFAVEFGIIVLLAYYITRYYTAYLEKHYYTI